MEMDILEKSKIYTIRVLFTGILDYWKENINSVLTPSILLTSMLCFYIKCIVLVCMRGLSIFCIVKSVIRKRIGIIQLLCYKCNS